MATIVFTWLPSPEPNVAGYKLYAGQASGVYNAPGSPKDMGNVTTGTFDINANGNWFFALTTYNTLGQESSFSAEITGKFLEGVVAALSLIGQAPVRSIGNLLRPRGALRGL